MCVCIYIHIYIYVRMYRQAHAPIQWRFEEIRIHTVCWLGFMEKLRAKSQTQNLKSRNRSRPCADRSHNLKIPATQL